MSEWQPIETAPRDGTHFLGLYLGMSIECWWSGGWGRFDHVCNDDNPPLLGSVTHWQALTPQPQAMHPLMNDNGACMNELAAQGYFRNALK